MKPKRRTTRTKAKAADRDSGRPKGESKGGEADVDVRVQFARRVRQLREERGLTQGQMAAACGLSHVYYGVLELGKKSASLETLAQLAQGCGVTLDQLLRFELAPGASPETPAQRLGRRVASLARGASEAQLSRVERVARIMLEPEAQ